MCKSYFNLPDLQNIRHEEPFFVVQGKYERGGEELTVYCGVKRGQKKVFKKNQKAIPYPAFIIQDKISLFHLKHAQINGLFKVDRKKLPDISIFN